jgi:uncharacterized Zn finger protein (UPF0148 family)
VLFETGMSTDDERRAARAGGDVLKVEALAEEAQRQLAEEGKKGLTNKCPDCGALGSLEEQEDGAVRCIDCDVVVGAARKMGGYGRK